MAVLRNEPKPETHTERCKTCGETITVELPNANGDMFVRCGCSNTEHRRWTNVPHGALLTHHEEPLTQFTECNADNLPNATEST